MIDVTNPALLDAHVTLREHVVKRDFVEETVLLNLQTGRYHGLNRTAGRALDALESGVSVREAARALAEHYRVPSVEVCADVLALCADLAERELIAIDDGSAG